MARGKRRVNIMMMAIEWMQVGVIRILFIQVVHTLQLTCFLVLWWNILRLELRFEV